MEGEYVRVTKYCTPLNAAQARKTATQIAAKDLFFHTTSGIMQVLFNFSCRLSQYKKVGNNTTAETVKAIGTGETNDLGDSATILQSVSLSFNGYTQVRKRTSQEKQKLESLQPNLLSSKNFSMKQVQNSSEKVSPTKLPQQPTNLRLPNNKKPISNSILK